VISAYPLRNQGPGHQDLRDAGTTCTALCSLPHPRSREHPPPPLQSICTCSKFPAITQCASASALLRIIECPFRGRTTVTYPTNAQPRLHLTSCRACKKTTSQDNSQTCCERAASGRSSGCSATSTGRFNRPVLVAEHPGTKFVPPPLHRLGKVCLSHPSAYLPPHIFPGISSPVCAPLTTPAPPSRRRSTGIYPPPQTLEQLCFCGAVIQTTSQASSQT